jgi:hypothetical protein
MFAEELIFLVNNLGSDPQTLEDQEKVTKALRELTKLQAFSISYEQYMLEQEAIAEGYRTQTA